MDTNWKSVPTKMTPAMRAAAAAAGRKYMEETGGNNIDVMWAAALEAAPAQPVAYHLEVAVTDRNGTYRAVPRAGAGTEAAGLKGQRASYFGGRESAIYRLLGKSSQRLDIDGAAITPMLPEAGDRIDVTRYSVIVGKRGQ